MSTFPRPGAEEYAEYYARYVGRVADGDVLGILRDQAESFRRLLEHVDDAQGDRGYAPGKWTLKEVVLHVTDAERVFAYRALRIARGDTMDLPGFDQDAWVPASAANDRPLGSLLGEFAAVRASTLTLLHGFPAAAWTRRGSASGYPVTVRGLAFIIAGHALHHEGIVAERYL